MDAEASSPPFGMSPALPAFHRATRIAEALFDGAEASVALVDGERVWRSGGSLVGADVRPTGVLYVIGQGRAGLARRPRGRSDRCSRRSTPDRPYARFWAGAPVRLADGVDHRRADGDGPRRRAPTTRCWPARLQDLADSVADECERARAAEIAAQRDRELRAARKVMSAFVGSVPIQSVMTDRDLRVLHRHAALAGSVRPDRGAGHGPHAAGDLAEAFACSRTSSSGAWPAKW